MRLAKRRRVRRRSLGGEGGPHRVGAVDGVVLRGLQIVADLTGLLERVAVEVGCLEVLGTERLDALRALARIEVVGIAEVAMTVGARRLENVEHGGRGLDRVRLEERIFRGARLERDEHAGTDEGDATAI